MHASAVEAVLLESERQALLVVVRSHPEWTLGELFSRMERGTRYGGLLAQLSLSELIAGPALGDLRLPDDGGPLIDRVLLARASRADGATFDRMVADVIGAAPHPPVAARYLRARVGGPRWKLQASLGRLVATGVVERSGKTSATRYRLVRPRKGR